MYCICILKILYFSIAKTNFFGGVCNSEAMRRNSLKRGNLAELLKAISKIPKDFELTQI